MNTLSTNLTEQETTWVHELASQLRLIQADAGSATPEERREYLAEEISRRFKEVAPANRKRYLGALLARFPVAGQVTGPVAPLVTRAAVVPETFDQLLERFLKAVAELPEDRRTEVAKRLGAAGLVWVDNEALVLEVSEDLRKGLGLPPEHQPRLRSVVQLCVQLVELVQRLDQAGLSTMQKLAPRSPLLKRPQEFRNAVAQFLTGQKESLEPEARIVSSLLGWLLAGMLGGVLDFGRQQVERISPSAIDDVVTGEGKGALGFMGPNKKERCWDRYCLLSNEMETADLVARRIRDCIAAFVEKEALRGR